MKEILILMLVCGVILQLNTLDTIYVGVYTDGDKDKLIEIEPKTLNYDIDIELKPNQEAYYFYNLGFGKL